MYSSLMAALPGTKKPCNEESIVYELCDKVIKTRNRFQESESQISCSNSVKIRVQPNCKSRNENLNIFQVHNQQQNIDNINVELQSAMEKIPIKSELHTKCQNVFLVDFTTDNDILSEKKDSMLNKSITATNYWIKYPTSNVMMVCFICGGRFKDRTELLRHHNQNHLIKCGWRSKSLVCSLCLLIFSCEKDHIRHFQIYHQDKIHECPICQEIRIVNVIHTCKKKVESTVWDKSKNVLNSCKSFKVGRPKVTLKDKCENVSHSGKIQKAGKPKGTVKDKCEKGSEKIQKVGRPKGIVKDKCKNVSNSSKIKKVGRPKGTVKDNSKNVSTKRKPKHNVWDACKKVLLERSRSSNLPISKKVILTSSNIPKLKLEPFLDKKISFKKNDSALLININSINNSSLNSTSSNQDSVEQLFGEYCRPKLPISKKVSMNTSSDEAELKFKTFLHKKNIVTKNYSPPVKGINSINNCSLNSTGSNRDAVEQLFGEFKNLDDFQAEAMDLAKVDDVKLFCNICGIFFKEIEGYEAHLSTHLEEEFCQIREGDEKLHVCFVCGGCFTDKKLFQAHTLTHVDI